MNDNIITAVFGALRETKVRPRYRYDQGQILVVKGVPNLPDFFEVHFANEGDSADATPLIGTPDGVTIPDSYFQSGKTVLAYIYVHDEATDGTTVYKVTIPIINRARTANIDPDPEQADIIAQAIVALNENVGKSEAAAEAAETAQQGAEAARDAAGTSADAAASSAQQSAQSAQSAAQSAQSAAQSVTAAAASAGQSAQSASDAHTYAETASDKALESSQSASAASTAAGTATTKATEAATSASNAASSATAAATSESNAADSATAAGASASTASTKAGEAASSASAAAQSATAAGNAQTAAEAAQQGAEDAAESVESSAAQISQNKDDITDLKSAVNENKNDINIYKVSSFIDESYNATFESDKYWNLETPTAVKTDLNYYRAGEIPVSPGDIYSVTAYIGHTDKTRLWAVVDDNYNVLSMGTIKNMTGYIKETEWCIIPDGGTKLLLTYLNNSNVSTPRFTLVKKIINYVSKTEYDATVYHDVSKNIINTSGAYWNVEAPKAIFTTIEAQFYASNPINVVEGETYIVTARQGTTDKARIWVVTDDEYNIISMCENFKGTASHTVVFTIPQNGTKLLLTKQATGSEQTLKQRMTAFEYVSDSPLKGKPLSLLGDSISAYAGTIPSGNDAYYTGSNSGVSSPNQMWWKVLCDQTGMTPLIINGWSGSGINWQTDSAHVNKVPMSDDSRCNGLHNGTTMPDVILIAGGVNDYTYAESAQNEPLEWDGKSVPTYTEPTAGKQVYGSFTEAYVAMIKKIQTNYPNAIVVALSTWFTMRGTDNGYTLTHAVGQRVYTQQDYNDKIRYVAEQMHIPYIDVSNIGFNRNNFYPTYASDSSTIPTHPNATGHSVMGKAIAEKLIALVDGFLA